LERQPVSFLGRRALNLLAEARQALAAYLGCRGDDLVYFTNPTTAINMVVRSLDLKPGDEVLTTDHEYGAMVRTWRYICGKIGAKLIQRPVPLPVTTHADFLEDFWGGVTDRTRVVFLSHITSPTALICPVKAISRRAREAGILSIIDGAHAPGQIDLGLDDIGADIYTGACHKWMLSPKGAAFLYVRSEIQACFDPLVVSWGYQADPGFGSGSRFLDYHQWQGTRDLAPFLAVPKAIEFMNSNQWDRVRQNCRSLAYLAREEIQKLTGLPPLCPAGGGWLGQMVAARLPAADPKTLKTCLYDRYRIEVPVMRWNEQTLIRVSIQAYNRQEEIETLVRVLKGVL
jgi:isopenicillin-N epimerase